MNSNIEIASNRKKRLVTSSAILKTVRNLLIEGVLLAIKVASYNKKNRQSTVKNSMKSFKNTRPTLPR